MTHRMQELATEIIRLQTELDREIEARRKILGWSIKKRFVAFEHGIAFEHRRLRVSVASFLADSGLAKIISAPVIYSLIVPIALLDLWAPSIKKSASEFMGFRAWADATTSILTGAISDT